MKCCESAALNMPANLENSAVATGLEKVSFHSNPKERQCQRMLKLLHNCTHLHIRWPNNRSFSFSVSPPSEYSDFFRMDWFDVLSVQGTLKSLLQHRSSKGIYVCPLSVTSYSPCWDLMTRTEFKQHAKMRIRSHCPI